MENSNPDVLIIGAGPTGLTMAADLLRRGIRVRIIDQALGCASAKSFSDSVDSKHVIYPLVKTRRLQRLVIHAVPSGGCKTRNENEVLLSCWKAISR